MGRILAIDYGDRHLGLALSDPLQITAQPFGTYTLKSSEQENSQFFSRLVKEKNIEEIVLGWPIRMDGSEGSRAELTRKFASWLEAVTGKKIILWDERLTTREALKRLDGFKGDFRQKKEKEDEQAAVIILETYLEKKRYEADHAEKNS